VAKDSLSPSVVWTGSPYPIDSCRPMCVDLPCQYFVVVQSIVGADVTIRNISFSIVLVIVVVVVVVVSAIPE
jgi:hypothetical protein